MIKQIFAIRDAKVEAFHIPFYSQTKGAAIRTISDYANEKGSPLNQHPEDFMLFHLGAFDELTGEIRSLIQPEPVITVLELMTDRPVTTEHVQEIDRIRKSNGQKPLAQTDIEEAITDAINRNQ